MQRSLGRALGRGDRHKDGDQWSQDPQMSLSTSPSVQRREDSPFYAVISLLGKLLSHILSVHTRDFSKWWVYFKASGVIQRSRKKWKQSFVIVNSSDFVVREACIQTPSFSSYMLCTYNLRQINVASLDTETFP